jgi:hypothetical protein
MSAPKNWRFVRVLLYTGSGFTGCQTCPVAAGLRFREKNQDSGDTCVASALVLGCVRPGSIAWFYCLVPLLRGYYHDANTTVLLPMALLPDWSCNR